MTPVERVIAAARAEIGYLESCEQNVRESGIRHLSTSQAWLEGGFMLDLHAEDMSFASAWGRAAPTP